MNGVTGRMGLNQHLRRSIYAIMQQGGVKLGPSEAIMPKPILVGRNSAKLEAAINKLDETQKATIYVLTLSEKDRARLNLNKPKALRDLERE